MVCLVLLLLVCLAFYLVLYPFAEIGVRGNRRGSTCCGFRLWGCERFFTVSYGKGFRSTWAAWDVDSVK